MAAKTATKKEQAIKDAARRIRLIKKMNAEQDDDAGSSSSSDSDDY